MGFEKISNNNSTFLMTMYVCLLQCCCCALYFYIGNRDVSCVCECVEEACNLAVPQSLQFYAHSQTNTHISKMLYNASLHIEKLMYIYIFTYIHTYLCAITAVKKSTLVFVLPTKIQLRSCFPFLFIFCNFSYCLFACTYTPTYIHICVCLPCVSLSISLFYNYVKLSINF